MTTRKINFRRRVFSSYLLLLWIIFMIALPICYYYLNRSLRGLEASKLSQVCGRTSAQIDERIGSLNNLSLYIAANPLVRNLLGGSSATGANSSIKDFVSMLVTMNVPASNTKQRISVYNDNGFFQSAGFAHETHTVESRLSSPEFKDWYQSLGTIKGTLILPPHNDFWSTDVAYQPVSLIRPLIDPRNFQRVGVVEVQMPLQSLASIIHTDGSEGWRAMLFDQTGQLILSSSHGGNQVTSAQSIADNRFFRMAGEADQGEILNSLWPGANDNLIVYSRSPLTGWVYMIALPSQVYNKALLNPFLVVSTVMILAMAFMSLISYLVSRNVVRPLSQLRDQVQAVDFQNLSINLPKEGENDEIDQLNNAFNQMFERLRESMNEVAAMRTRELQAHLIALQAQIDPHFIFNILSIITALSREQGLTKVIEISNHLSAILRYSTSQDQDLVSLEQEIQHIENYLVLMKLRYEENLDFAISLEPDLPASRIKLPRLSLQPIIENSFRHGFKQVLPPYRLNVRVGQLDDRRWWLEVSENGGGMSLSEIDHLKSRLEEFYINPAKNIKELKLGGMGLVNTLARLKFLYQDDFSYRIESLEDGYKGFKITITGSLTVPEQLLPEGGGTES